MHNLPNVQSKIRNTFLVCRDLKDEGRRKATSYSLGDSILKSKECQAIPDLASSYVKF
jgi:hypothetical protein